MPSDLYVYNVSQQLLTHIQVQPNVVLILQLTLYVFEIKLHHYRNTTLIFLLLTINYDY